MSDRSLQRDIVEGALVALPPEVLLGGPDGSEALTWVHRLGVVAIVESVLVLCVFWAILWWPAVLAVTLLIAGITALVHFATPLSLLTSDCCMEPMTAGRAVYYLSFFHAVAAVPMLICAAISAYGADGAGYNKAFAIIGCVLAVIIGITSISSAIYVTVLLPQLERLLLILRASASPADFLLGVAAATLANLIMDAAATQHQRNQRMPGGGGGVHAVAVPVGMYGDSHAHAMFPAPGYAAQPVMGTVVEPPPPGHGRA